MPTIEERLQALEDKEAVLRTLHDYAHALDYGRDGDAWADLFTEDGVWKGRPVTNTAGAGGDRVEGRAALREWYLRSGRDKPEYWDVNLHRAGHPTISVVDIRVDGDRATSECYMTIVAESANGPIVANIGRYLDVLVRCPDGRWRFKVRNLERTCTTPDFQVRAMNTPGPEESAAMRARFQQELAAAAVKRRA